MEKQTITAPRDGALLIDLSELCRAAEGSGPQWGHESGDLDLTLLSWEAGGRVAPHVNDEVDVFLIALDGAGEVAVGAETHPLRPGQALLIPKGAERSIRCTGDRFRYLNVHRRRRGLWPTIGGQPAPRPGTRK
jgi:mannose-6-phosphate isomerase-like protein (cupin superfamily)